MSEAKFGVYVSGNEEFPFVKARPMQSDVDEEGYALIRQRFAGRVVKKKILAVLDAEQAKVFDAKVDAVRKQLAERGKEALAGVDEERAKVQALYEEQMKPVQEAKAKVKALYDEQIKPVQEASKAIEQKLMAANEAMKPVGEELVAEVFADEPAVVEAFKAFVADSGESVAQEALGGMTILAVGGGADKEDDPNVN